jgi:hypothetical protein
VRVWLVVILCVLGLARTALADDAAVELQAGIAAREAKPPNKEAAELHLERAAKAADDRTAADALFLLGELADDDMRFGDAADLYEASAKRLASGRFTPRALRRARELRSRAEGAWEPLRKLETVRRSESLANDPLAIDALVRDAASFPPGKVRVEARVLAAEAYAGRLKRKDEALPLLELVIDDSNAEPLTARASAEELLAEYLAKGDLTRALALAETHSKILPKTATKDVLRVMRRRTFRAVAWVDLGVLGLFALLAAVRRDRAQAIRAVRDLLPMALVFSLVACGIGGYLASRYERSSPYPFTAMLPAMLAVALCARAWSATGARAAAARVFRSAVAFVGVFAAAFLLLDHMDPSYLSGFGL